MSVLFDMNVLYKSFQKCKRDVDWKYSVQRFEQNLLINLYKLKKELQTNTYKQKPFFEFDLCERGKMRHITALNIRDRVIQRSLCDEILMPQLSKYLIYDNGASVKGKGIDFARNRLKKHLRQYYINEKTNEGYILKIDFSKYFDSIDHEIAIKFIDKYIGDKYITELVSHMIDGYSKGIGLGSQVSQVIGLIYAIPIDNFCKIVKSCKYYGRYMDDIYVIHRSKEFLRALLLSIHDIAESIKLLINEKKTQIYKISKRFVFLKINYFLTITGKVIMIPDKTIVIREKRKLRKFKKENKPLCDIENQFKSVKGMIQKYDGYNLIQKLEEYKIWVMTREDKTLKLS